MQGYKIYLEKHKKQQSSINMGMKKSSDNKEYLIYLQHFGIKDITTQNSKTSIYRFGIRIEKLSLIIPIYPNSKNFAAIILEKNCTGKSASTNKRLYASYVQHKNCLRAL